MRAVIDACVLYDSNLRSIVMYQGTMGTCEIFWNQRIQAEWRENLLIKRPNLSRDSLESACEAMDSALPTSCVVGYTSLLPSINLDDPDDCHVVATAMSVSAEYIVTFNVTDFPISEFVRLNIPTRAIHPDNFLCLLLNNSHTSFLAALSLYRNSLSKPPYTQDDVMELLRKRQMPNIATMLNGQVF